MSKTQGPRERGDVAEEFSKRLNRYRNLLHGAVIEDCKDYPSDRRLHEAWAKAEAAEDDLLEWTRAALERVEALEAVIIELGDAGDDKCWCGIVASMERCEEIRALVKGATPAPAGAEEGAES